MVDRTDAVWSNWPLLPKDQKVLQAGCVRRLLAHSCQPHPQKKSNTNQSEADASTVVIKLKIAMQKPQVENGSMSLQAAASCPGELNKIISELKKPRWQRCTSRFRPTHSINPIRIQSVMGLLVVGSGSRLQQSFRLTATKRQFGDNFSYREMTERLQWESEEHQTIQMSKLFLAFSGHKNVECRMPNCWVSGLHEDVGPLCTRSMGWMVDHD